MVSIFNCAQDVWDYLETFRYQLTSPFRTGAIIQLCYDNGKNISRTVDILCIQHSFDKTKASKLNSFLYKEVKKFKYLLKRLHDLRGGSQRILDFLNERFRFQPECPQPSASPSQSQPDLPQPLSVKLTVTSPSRLESSQLSSPNPVLTTEPQPLPQSSQLTDENSTTTTPLQPESSQFSCTTVPLPAHESFLQSSQPPPQDTLDSCVTRTRCDRCAEWKQLYRRDLKEVKDKLKERSKEFREVKKAYQVKRVNQAKKRLHDSINALKEKNRALVLENKKLKKGLQKARDKIIKLGHAARKSRKEKQEQDTKKGQPDVQNVSVEVYSVPVE